MVKRKVYKLKNVNKVLTIITCSYSWFTLANQTNLARLQRYQQATEPLGKMNTF